MEGFSSNPDIAWEPCNIRPKGREPVVKQRVTGSATFNVEYLRFDTLSRANAMVLPCLGNGLLTYRIARFRDFKGLDIDDLLRNSLIHRTSRSASYARIALWGKISCLNRK